MHHCSCKLNIKPAPAAPISTALLPRCTMNAAPAPEPEPYARTLENMGAAYELLDHTGKTPLLKSGNWATDGFRCATGYDRPNAAVRLRVIYVVHDPETQYWKIGQTVEHDRPVLASISEQAGQRPWRIVGLAIGVRPYRPHTRIASVVPNLDDDLRRAMVDLGYATHVSEPGRGTGVMGREWVALRVDIPEALRFLETECWRRGHAWLEPNIRPRSRQILPLFSGTATPPATSGAAQLGTAPNSVATTRRGRRSDATGDGTVPYEQFRSGTDKQAVVHRTSRGPATVLNAGADGGGASSSASSSASASTSASTSASASARRAQYPGQMAGQVDPVLAFVRFRNNKTTSEPFELSQADRAKLRAASARQQKTWQETQSQWQEESQLQAGSNRTKRQRRDTQTAQESVAGTPQQLLFAGCAVLPPANGTITHGSLVFVPENTRYQFSPECDDTFLEFARSLPIGLHFTAQHGTQPSTCNGYFGVVVNPKHNGNDIVTFDLVWGHEPHQNFPYTTSARRIRHIGRLSPGDADTLEAAAAVAAPPPPPPPEPEPAPATQNTAISRERSGSEVFFRLRMRVRPA